MKRTRILLTLLLMVSMLTVMGISSILNYRTNQTIKMASINTSKQELTLKAVNNETGASSATDHVPQKELVGEFKLTFYTASANETDDSPTITASGAQLKPGITVAVDPRYWKFGTKFYIEGYGYVVAEDTGSNIKGPHAMDVSVNTKDQALKNGIQYRNVWVVKA